MFKNVFLSYAKEDIDFSEKLYDFLLGRGYNPWLDKRKLKSGANWDYEIKKALRESNYVIILLSSTSVNKRGYVQREYKIALEYAETKLEDDIYIIPILLDKCLIPTGLEKFHWTEYNDEKGFEKILESLDYQREKYLLSTPKDQLKLSDYVETSFELKVPSKSNIDFVCNIPKFLSNPYFDENFVNTYIHHAVFEIISDYRNFLPEYLAETTVSHISIEIGSTINFLSPNILSLSISHNNYLGGPYPSTYLKTLNFCFSPERKVSLTDLIQFTSLKNFLEENIIKYADEDSKDALLDYKQYFNNNNIEFLIREKYLEIILMNEMPHAIQALGFLEIPMKSISLKISII